MQKNFMADIRVISASTIQAAANNGDLTQKIELTPWDLQFIPLSSIQKGLLFHNPKSKHTLIHHLKQSLSTTLNYFPPLAGRLAIVNYEDKTSSFFIVCNNAGVLFTHAAAEHTTVADILEPGYVPPIVRCFFPLNGVRNYEGTDNPLLAVQVTELVDGIFIGCTLNHSAADGSSFWNFFNSWAEISRGLDKISRPPSLDRWFLGGINRPLRIPFAKEKLDSDRIMSQTPPPEMIFHFTKKKISQLKAKANGEIKSDKISSLQALLTHVWGSVIRHQRPDPQEEVHYKLVIGVSVRSRIRNPPLAENYLGNGVQFDIAVTMKAGELLEGGLGKAALEMNKMISLQTEEKLKRDYESWVKSPNLFSLSVITSSGNALGTSSSPRFDFYGNDFGWGRPIAVRSGAAHKSHGKLTVFGGAEEGSVDIELCLPRETLETLQNDSQFVDAVFN